MRKIKIVFFVDVLRENFDGVSNTSHQIISRIPNERIEPIFVTPLAPANPDFPYPVYKCPSYDIPFYKEYKYATPGRMKNLEQILNDFGPDMVHWSSPSTLGAYALKYAKKHGIPAATIYHTHFPSYLEYYLNFLPGIDRLSTTIARTFFSMYRKTDLVLAPTVSMKTFLIKIDVEADKVKVWGRGVNTERFNPRFKNPDFFKKYQLGNAPKVLFVSRLVHYKETDTLIRLHDLFASKGYDFIITGDGPDRKRMQRKMPKATFTGKLTGDELSQVFASSDVFVFTSLTETFGNVILEAMASGLPVVAVRSGGPADIIEHGETGYLATPRDEFEIFRYVNSIIEDQALADSFSKTGLKYANEQNWAQLCEKLFVYYSELVKQ